MNNKLQLQEIKRWLKTSLKNKVSINNKTIITYLMLGLVGVSNIAFSGWSYKSIRVNAEGSNNAPNAVRSLTVDFADGETKTDNGSIIFAEGHRINTKLKNSVVIGYAQGKKSQKLEIDVENGDSEHSIIAIGSAKVLSNPYLLGRTGSGGQAVSIGSEVVSTTQAVAIGNNTYALGASSIAIGNDDNESYYDNKISYYDYFNYLKDLYTVLNRDSNSENNTSDSTGTSNDVYNTTYKSQYSPNVAKGKGSIAIGSRALAFNDGSTSLGTLAFALGKGATALGTLSRAEGEGSIAIGNKTRNFADQALAIGNDSQIRYKGGTAIGLKARSAGEGAIAIGTEVYSNASINNSIRNVKNKSINEIENYLNNLTPNTTTKSGIDGIVKNTNDGSTNLAKNAIAIGTKSAAVGDNSIVLGRGSFAFAKNSFALGSYSYAESENGAAIGIGAKSISYENSDNRNNDNYMHNGKNAMAIGNGALATLENSISIGVNSKTDYSYNELLKPGWLPNGATSIPSSGKTGVISVGSKGFERRLINLAPGYRGTDAVNVDQLKSFENRLENKQYDSGFTMQYISVEKNQGKAKEISDKLKLNSEYIEYIDLREQLELIKARHKFKDEEIVAETKTTIETRIAELERNPLIKTTAGAMGTYTSDSLPTGTSEQDKENNFKEFYNNLEAKKKEALKEETKKPLFGNKLLKDVLAKTNYNNDGATGKDAMAFGYRTEASGEASIAIGAPSNPAGSTSNDVITKATGIRAIAIGAGAVNTGEYSVALGSNSKVTVREGVAIGDRAEATLEKSVAIGSGSTVTANSGSGYLTNQAKPEDGMVVSVGDRRIQKLKDGSADDDAVTVAQLKKLKEQTLTRDNAKITIAPDENGTQEFTIGSTINLKTNDAWGSGDGRFVGDNIETYKKDDGTILIGVKENSKFKTISLNNKENNAIDLTLSSDKNGNLSLGNKKIINVGEGSITSNSTDVVIGKQLKATEDKIETLKGNALTKTEASTTYVTKTEAGNLKLKYAANKDAAKEVFLSSGLKFKDGTNTKAEVEDNGVVRFNLNKDLTGITSITSGENKAKLTFGDNITVNSKKITGLSDATLSASSTDAVTGKQLNTTNTNVTNLTTKVGTIESNITTLTNNGIKFKGDTGSEITTKLGSTLNIKGDDSSITTNSSGAIIKISVKDGGISKEKLSNDLKTTINNSLSKSDANSTYAKKDASNIDENKYISKLNNGASITQPSGKLVKDSDVKNYLTTNYITKTEVESKVNASKTIVEASTGSPITVSSSTSGSANKYTIGIDSDKLKEIAGTKEKGNVTSTDINVTNGDGRVIGNTELKLSIKNGAITKEKLENDLKTKIEKIADDANGTYATKTELNSKANKDATNLSEAEITKWKEKLGVTNIDLSYKAGADAAAKTTTLSNGLHFKSDGGNLSVKSENNGVITYSISQTDSINKNAGTTGNTNKLTTEKAVKDYVASEIAGINTILGNATLTLSKNGTEETEKINLKSDKLTVKGINGIDVSIADKGITVKIDDTTKGKIDGALSKTEASTTYITKTEAGNTYVTKTEVSNTKLKYAANKDTAKEVTLNTGLKFTNGTNTTAEVADNGVVKFNLNKDLTGITSITSGDNKAKLTLGDDDITVNSKKITGLADAELSASSTEAVTGKQLKSTEDKVTTLNTKVETITNNITTLTSGGIKFKGNDNGEVTTALGSKLNLVGEGVNSSDTFNSASGNIKVEKGTSTDTLTFKLSKDLKNIKSIELKDGDKTSTLSINNEGDVTIGGNKVVTTNNIGAQTIGYKAGTDTAAKTTTLSNGLHFKSEGSNLSVKSENNGVITYSISQTDSINKNAGTTGNANKLTTEKAVKDYVASEIAGINTTVGNATLTLSKDGTEETSKLNLKSDKLTVKGTNGIDVSIADKAITVKIDDTTKGKIDGALSKTEASTTYITKTEAGNTYVTKTEVVNTKLKYAANKDTAKEVTLNTGLKFTNGTNTTAEVADNGVVKFNLNTDLTGITSITSGENKAKLTFGDNIEINSKKITGLADAELSASSTDAVTGKQLKSTEDKVTTLTTNVNNISSNITNLTSGGIKFKGNDNGEVTTALGSTLNLVGEGVDSTDTFNSASGNIKVEKGTSTDTLTFKLSKDLKNIKSIELKDGNKTSTLTINNEGDVTIGGNKVVTTNNIGAQSIGYKANGTGDKTTTLTNGFNFLNGTNTIAEISDNGGVKFNLNSTLTGITSITSGENKAKLTLGDDDISLNDKKITGIMNGSLSATSKDAITGSQLYDVLSKIELIDKSGNIVKPKINDITSKDGNTTKSETIVGGINNIINTLNNGITFAGVEGSSKQYLGSTLTIKNGDITNNNIKFKGENLITKYTNNAGDGTLTIGLKESPTFKEVTISDKATINGKEVATKDDLSNVNSAITLNLTKDGTTNHGSVNLKDQKLKVTGEDGLDVEISGQDIKVKLGSEFKKKVDKIINNPADGKDGKNGTEANSEGSKGITGKDGLNGKDLTDKVNALRNGEAGTVIFTNENGDRLYKGNDGKYYLKDQLNDNGTPKTGFENSGIENPELRLVNADGTTTKATTLNNLANGLAGITRDTDKPITPEKAKEVITALLTQTTGLDKAVNVGDLQALAQAGLDFIGNDNTVSLHRALGKALQISGERNTDETFESASDNINVRVLEDATKNISKLEIQLAKALKNIESIQNGDTKITLDKDKSNVEIANGDKAKTTINEEGIKVIGKDGKDAVSINGTDGTNGASVIVKGKDGADGVTIKGGNGTDAPSIDFAKKTENGNTTGTGTITGLKDPDGNDKTAATTVNYVTNEITKATTSLTDKGLKFVGNDGNEVTKKLGETLSIKGEGVSSSDTFNSASGNIKVSKGTDGLEIGLSKNIKNIETIELKGKDGVNGTIGIDKGELTLTKDSKTTKILTEANIGDQKIKYKANDGTSKEVKLSDGFNFTNGENTTAEVGDNGVVKVNVNSKLNNIESIAAKDSTKGIEITNGDKAKTTINEDGIKVIGKDGKDAVTVNGTDGTNGASVIVKGKDGADGVTIKGGNGTDTPSIDFAKKTENGNTTGTGTITGLKDPDGNDKTTATTVNYVTNAITNVTNTLTDKGLKFVGNDGNEVTKKLGETLSIKGEGVSSSDTFNSASGNIKVSKVTDGLEIGLSKNIKNIETIELKGKDGVNGTIGIDKGELTLTKDSKTTKILTEANIGDQKIKYKANDGTSKEVKLSDGFNFTNGENTTAEIGDNGVVKVSVNSTLNKMKAINFENGKITGLATPDGKDVTSAANVAYVDKKVSNVEHLSNKALSGVANAIAMANLPQITANSEYNTSIGASYGTYNGENSLALGVSGVNNKANFLYRASASLNTKGNVAFGIGLGYQFGKKKDILENSKLSKLELKLNTLKEENETNKSKVSELEVIIKEISKENDKLRKEINEKDIQNEYRVIRLEEQNIEMKNYLEKLILENQKNKEILEKLLKNSESK